MDTEVKTELQLQFWNPKERSYVPTDETVPQDFKAVQALADMARNIAKGRGWRICKPWRNRKKVFQPTESKAPSRTVENVQCDYLRWAQAEGLAAVHMYTGRPAPNFEMSRHGYRDTSKPIFHGKFLFIDKEAQFAVEECTE